MAEVRKYESRGEMLSLAKWCEGSARTSGRIIVNTPEGERDAWPGDLIVKRDDGLCSVIAGEQ